MSREIFKDKTLQLEFDQRGYVVIPFLDQEQVQELLAHYQSTQSAAKPEYGFHISLDNPNKNEVQSISETIMEKLQPAAAGVFHECKIFTASYVIKEPGLQNIVPPHQDWTFTDESKFNSATVWTPLVDVHMKNGALGLIDGSHHFFDHPRSSPSPQSRSPLTDHVFTLFPYSKIIEVPAGHAIVFDNRVVHSSPPNTTDQPRIAVGIGIMQEEAPLLHYYQLPDRNEETLAVYEVTRDFFNKYDNGTLSKLFDKELQPEGLKSLGNLNRKVPKFSKEEMENLVLSVPGNSRQEELTEYLKSLYPQHVPKKEPQNQSEEVEQPATEEKLEEWEDPRSFFEKYTLRNIIAEIMWRLGGRK